VFCRLGGKPPGTFLSAKIEKTCNRAVLAASIMLTMAVQQPYLWAYGTAISLVVLLCAERGIPIAQVGRRDQSLVPFSGGRNQTAYQSLLRMQRERRATGTSEPDSVGPLVAKAELRSMPAMGVDWTGYLALQRRDTTLARPADLREVPADAPEEPVYFLVRVGDRNMPGVTYRSTRGWRPIKLYLDTNGDGLLSDEKEYVGTWLSMFRLTNTYQFGPVWTAQGDVRAGAGAFHTQCSDGRWLVFYPAFYREGQVVLDGKAYRIAIVDSDFDGRYNKLFVPPAENSRQAACDVFAIDLNGNSKFNYGEPGDSEIMPLSRLVRVNQDYYSIHVAEDGGTVEFRRAEPAFGVLDVGGEEVQLSLWSDAARQRLSGSEGQWRLPAGRYAVVSLELTETDSAGNRWTFKTSKAGTGKLGDFEIGPGESTSFRIGPPFRIRTSMERSGENALVGFYLEGQAGELYIPGGTRNGTTVPEPEFKIINGSEQVVHSGRFKYG